jgi:hypothetical protein
LKVAPGAEFNIPLEVTSPKLPQEFQEEPNSNEYHRLAGSHIRFLMSKGKEYWGRGFRRTATKATTMLIGFSLRSHHGAVAKTKTVRIQKMRPM